MVKSNGSPGRGSSNGASAGFEIVLDPHRPGRHRARVEPYGVAVWALIAHYRGVNGGSIGETAKSYGVPESAVRAALAYYEADPRFVDAFLLLNREELGAHGDDAGAALRVGKPGNTDLEQLAIARRTGRVFVTHDRAYALLHEAWRAWTAEWGLAETRHPGIVILPDAGVLPAEAAAEAIDALAKEQTSFENRLFEYNARDGWRERMP